ncbi:hypothetical protein GCM10009772_18430 [Pseudonocardia alni subsp. carboxydivorans]
MVGLREPERRDGAPPTRDGGGRSDAAEPRTARDRRGRGRSGFSRGRTVPAIAQAVPGAPLWTSCIATAEDGPDPTVGRKRGTCTVTTGRRAA